MLHEIDYIAGIFALFRPFGRFSPKVRVVLLVEQSGTTDAIEDLSGEKEGQLDIDHFHVALQASAGEQTQIARD